MRAILAASVLALSGCETVRVQGVEVTQEEQIAWALFLTAVGTAIYHYAQEFESTPNKPQCKTETEVGTCAIPLDEVN